MQKSDRQKAILNIIAAQRVTRQDELAAALHREGFEVTQASISRDLDELGVEKLNGRYARHRQEVPLLPFGPVSVVTSGDSLIVAKCGSGLASAAAVRIDAEDLPGVAGTIAGDDTIFVAIRKGASQDAVANALYELFTFENGGNKE